MLTIEMLFFEFTTRPPIEEFVRGRMMVARRAKVIMGMAILVVRELGCV